MFNACDEDFIYVMRTPQGRRDVLRGIAQWPRPGRRWPGPWTADTMTRSSSPGAFTRWTREIGKAADLVVLERDPTTVLPDTLRSIRVHSTWLAGEGRFQ